METKSGELKRKIREAQAENEELQARVMRAQRHLMRLRLERRILLEKYQELQGQETTLVTGEESTEQNQVKLNNVAIVGENERHPVTSTVSLSSS